MPRFTQPAILSFVSVFPSMRPKSLFCPSAYTPCSPAVLDCSHFPDLASGLTCPMAQSRLSYSHCTVTQACHTIPPSRNWSGHMMRCFNLECQSHLDHDTNDSYTHLLPSPDKSIFSVQLTNYPNTNPHSYLITMYITIPVLIFFPLLPSAGCLR